MRKYLKRSFGGMNSQKNQQKRAKKLQSKNLSDKSQTLQCLPVVLAEKKNNLINNIHLPSNIK